MATSVFAHEFASHVATLAGATSGQDLFVDVLPDAPDAAVLVRVGAADPPPGDEPRLPVRVRVVVRDATVAAARTRAHALYDALHRGASGTHRIQTGSFIFLNVQAAGAPARLADDARGRRRFAFELQLDAFPAS